MKRKKDFEHIQRDKKAKIPDKPQPREQKKKSNREL